MTLRKEYKDLGDYKGTVNSLKSTLGVGKHAIEIKEINNAIAKNNVAERLDIDTIYQSCWNSIVGTISTAGNLSVTITAAELTGSPKVLNVPVLVGDTSQVCVTKIKSAIENDADLNAYFHVSASDGSRDIYLICRNIGYDETLSFVIANGTAAGLNPSPIIAKNLNEIVHNSVLYFPNKWNGYYYWMAFTPYPASHDQFENPSILASNDKKTWVTPAGVINPLVAAESPEITTYYYSDPCLVADPDGKNIHLIYRLTDYRGEGGVDSLFYISSSDGFITISEPEEIISEDVTVSRSLSPSVIWDGNQWVMWAVDIVPATNTLIRRTCATLNGSWSTSENCTITIPSGKHLWHMEVKKAGTNLFMLAVIGDSKSGGLSELYFGFSNNGYDWIISESLMKHPTNPVSTYYKSSMIQVVTENGIEFDLWYSVLYPFVKWTLRHTTISFNKQLQKNRYYSELFAAQNLVYPYIFSDIPNTRENGALTTASCGKAYTVDAGGLVISNGIITTATDGTTGINSYDLGVADYSVSAKISGLATGTWISVRYADSLNRIQVGAYADSVDVMVRVSGKNIVNKVIGNVDCNYSYGEGDILRADCVGSLISVYVNDVLFLSFEETDLIANTKIAIEVKNTGRGLKEIFAKAI